ncbi:hypothetical protein TPHA_0G02220 [Tetrapisispora phaffii CBS 4417]|uniref:Uncharacterized protein n=1 Tax=Tetrapisispora phaffii (strain ATCC 24235 / CBS 4417 / NBRC 1672 / NRRL Y-8282 / UCD 70-5) TaxID=1071381 RepID=G8BVY0_TETPH|nr:hypothetical protein TPHA_0G02220 [Tetrapisispora phaffii CBS 4417]CCE64058.1 hypothetical protein TPHA_0G02220 [Tetrapisispora phaffii CBS 4417]
MSDSLFECIWSSLDFLVANKCTKIDIFSDQVNGGYSFLYVRGNKLFSQRSNLGYLNRLNRALELKLGDYSGYYDIHSSFHDKRRDISLVCPNFATFVNCEIEPEFEQTFAIMIKTKETENVGQQASSLSFDWDVIFQYIVIKREIQYKINIGRFNTNKNIIFNTSLLKQFNKDLNIEHAFGHACSTKNGCLDYDISKYKVRISDEFSIDIRSFNDRLRDKKHTYLKKIYLYINKEIGRCLVDELVGTSNTFWGMIFFNFNVLDSRNFIQRSIEIMKNIKKIKK